MTWSTWLSDRLAAIAASVPDEIDGFRLDEHSAEVFSDRRIFDVASYPDSMWKKPGDKAPNRAGLAAWGAYVNSLALRDYGRPLFIAASADLAESTNIAGFGQDYDGSPGTGWYERDAQPDRRPAAHRDHRVLQRRAGRRAGHGQPVRRPVRAVRRVLGRVLHLRLVLLPQVRARCGCSASSPRTPSSRSARCCGSRATPARRPPRTPAPTSASSPSASPSCSRTGTSSTCTRGSTTRSRCCSARRSGSTCPIVALHLTRPPIEIPDREALGIPSHFEAARGAYVLRDYRPGQPRGGTVYVRGTMPTAEPGQPAARAGRPGH